MADLAVLTCTATSPSTGAQHGGGSPFSRDGAAYHATWCAAFRAANGIADDAPGVRASKGADAAPVTVADLMAAMAQRASSQPVADAPAGETVIIDGIAYRKA